MITRRPLREEVRGEILRRVLRGELAPGVRLKEVALADNLGVSRTPLREALRDLEHIGIVSCTPGRGYAVKNLDPKEARDTFPMLSALEDLALSSTPASGNLVEQLGGVSRGDLTPVEADLRWHEVLAAQTDNPRLNRSVVELQAAVQRYECGCLSADAQEALRRDHDDITRAVEQALVNGSSDEAARLLRGHRERALGLVLDALGSGTNVRSHSMSLTARAS